MYESPVSWGAAEVAARELRGTNEGTHVSALTQTRAFAASLAPKFSTDNAPPEFEPALWLRILRFSYVPISDEEALDPERVYAKAKETYSVLERVANPIEAANASDIDVALKFCNGIERGARRHTTARRLGDLTQ